MKKIVAIHQPNFFPWLGYFDKILKADIFLVMDNVQFPKTGGTLSNRVRMMVDGEARWVTMPIVRSYHGTRRIDDMQIGNINNWRTKLTKTIQTNYSNAPFFKVIFPYLKGRIDNPSESLLQYNLDVIRSLATVLQLNPNKLILGSTLNAKGNATDLLVSMVESVGGTAYLCGAGAGGYQEDNKFKDNGIELIYQNFKHPVYPQFNTSKFIPGLSLVDVLMNCGFEGTEKILKNNCF